MASLLFSLTLTPNTLLSPSSSSSSSSSSYLLHHTHSFSRISNGPPFTRHLLLLNRRTSSLSFLPFVGKEDTDLRLSTQQQEDEDEEEEEEDDDEEPTPEDLQYVNQIKTVLELLRKNRDMLFGEVKLTIMIEDPREIERRRLLGIEDPDGPTRDDLVAALEEVNEGKVPTDKVALKMLAEELAAWPNLEIEATKKKPSKSLYAKATDTGIDPKVAAKKLNIDWDSAAEIDDVDDDDDTEVPPAVVFY
ncbi:Ycf3-interacting protein 1, chloroplastic, variant 2 [Stylosanthes scabra]|uniref:Ycf3-interacting protein 1, chloroplastic, variant 2 n=1 Tax=Stylosanthes scabra TaxID=79078 RepID=A0ABU6RAW0_9FABA|nr:Ycf3-interacting protein 1, chloroplastic, variant 2 [Stylosanthes scabra]